MARLGSSGARRRFSTPCAAASSSGPAVPIGRSWRSRDASSEMSSGSSARSASRAPSTRSTGPASISRSTSSRAGGRSSAAGAPWRRASMGIWNRPVGPHVPGRTSGSGGAPTPVPADLEFLRDRAVNSLVVALRPGRPGLAPRHVERAGLGRARARSSGSPSPAPAPRVVRAGPRGRAGTPSTIPLERPRPLVGLDGGRARHPPSRARFPRGSRPHRPLDRRDPPRGVDRPPVRPRESGGAALPGRPGGGHRHHGHPVHGHRGAIDRRAARRHPPGRRRSAPHVRERRGRRHRRGVPPPRRPGRRPRPARSAGGRPARARRGARSPARPSSSRRFAWSGRSCS